MSQIQLRPVVGPYIVQVYADPQDQIYFFEEEITKQTPKAALAVHLASQFRGEKIDCGGVQVLCANKAVMPFLVWLARLFEEATGIEVIPLAPGDAIKLQAMADDCQCPVCQARRKALFMRGPETIQ